MTTTASSGGGLDMAHGATRLPGTFQVGFARARIELRNFFRETDGMLFTFALPLLLLLIFGAIFNGTVGNTDVSYRQYFIAGIIASGMMSTTFNILGSAVAVEREEGTLKRLAGTPMPKTAYFVGKILFATVLTIMETIIMLGVGMLVYGLRLPAQPARWLTFGWVFLLSIATCTLLGMAASTVPRSSRSAAAVISLPYLLLQFISGVYFPFTTLPKFMQQIAAIFPLKWMCQGLRSVFLPDALLPAEPADSWEHWKVALILVAWGAAGLYLCLTSFRWTSRNDG
jgi:ABC-2 type transport system permease protein